MDQVEYDFLMTQVALEAERKGFTKEDLHNFSLDGIWEMTRAKKMVQLLPLAYYKGWCYGIHYVRDMRSRTYSPSSISGYEIHDYDRLIERIIRNSRQYDTVDAIKPFNLEGMDRWTKSQKYRRLIQLAFLRGMGRGIKSVREAETPIQFCCLTKPVT